MTIQTPSRSTATTTSLVASLIKRTGRVSYRLLERLTESAYRQHQARLRNHFYI